MVVRFAQRHPLRRVLFQKPAYKIPSLCFDLWGIQHSIFIHLSEINLYILDAVHLQFGDVFLEGREPSQQLKGEDAQTPQIDSDMILPLLEYLRGDIIQRPAEGLLHAGLAVGRPPKVAYFECVVGHDDIFGFDIAVGDVIAVEVVDGPEHLHHGLADELLLALAVVHEHPAVDILHQQKHMVLVFEVGVQLDDVRVAQFVVDFQLLGELVHHPVLQDRRLEDLLQRE